MTKPWLQTIHPDRELRRFDLINPTAAMVHFPSMALVLARIPRFGGHTQGGDIYSVAQHSVEGARALVRDGHPEAAAALLLHDGHEYVMGDIATPVARALAVHAEYATGDINAGDIVDLAIRRMKSTIDAAIYEAAGMAYPLRPEVRALVKEYDLRMCRTERDVRMAERPMDWGSAWESVEPLPYVNCGLWSAERARSAFHMMCREMLPICR